MMRTHQAMAVGQAQGYLPPDHYAQIFSAHGVIMIFFVAMPLVIGLMNFVVPLQLGVRDVAFPVLNSVSFWLTASGALLVNASLVIGNFARTGWMGYPPLSELAFSPDVGVDYYLWWHCQLKQGWYASSVGGAVARCGEVLCTPIGLPPSQRRGAGKLTSTPLS
jgi:cytochrome o ubiquinol oxidase subunit 1